MFARLAVPSPLAKTLVAGTVRRRCGLAALVGNVEKSWLGDASCSRPPNRQGIQQQKAKPRYQKVSLFQRRHLSSPPPEVDLVLDIEAMQSSILKAAPAMAEGLCNRGHYCTGPNFIPHEAVVAMRQQAIELRSLGRYEQSWSERIVDGKAVRFDKDGVFACEPDGGDYFAAPDLITYMAILLQTLPGALNGETTTAEADLSASSFNAKLAVTCPGGSKYPLHIDNPQGLVAGDTRKLTCILYLNPDYKDGDGGELRLLLDNGDETLEKVDLTPLGGRLLLFWSDEIPHEVLPTAPNGRPDDVSLDRYALTVWIPTDSAATAIHSARSKFSNLKDLAF